MACCYAGVYEGAPDQVILGARYERATGRWAEPQAVSYTHLTLPTKA